MNSYPSAAGDMDDHDGPIERPFRLRMPDEFRGLTVDTNMWDSLMNYIWYGLHPGSYGERILVHDYEGAIERAHVTIRSWRDSLGDDVTLNMINMLKAFPDVCHGDISRVNEWQAKGGLQNQPKLRVLFKLMF